MKRGKWDKYDSFHTLENYEIEGWDYSVEAREGCSGILVMAIHGGGIEPGTTPIANTIAGNDHSYYSFCGKDYDHHITSHLFDEPLALELSNNASIVVTIHRMPGDQPFVLLGGLHNELRAAMSAALHEAHFVISDIRERQFEGFRGERTNNICNNGTLGEGLQIEISDGLMREFNNDPVRLELFISIIRNVLDPFRSQSTDI